MTSRGDAQRIGGAFELHPERLPRDPIGVPPSLGSRSELWTDTGRGALLLAARELLRRGGRPHAWLPAYACESVVQPFLQAGYAISYYSLDGRLQDRPANLPNPAAGETFLFIHYFGQVNRVLDAHAHRLKQSGVWVIEDCVQAGLSAGVGGLGHYAIASYRKLLPQPDGALLASESAIDANLQEPDERFVSGHALGQLLRATSDFESARPLLVDAEELLRRQISPRRISWLSDHLMRRTDLDLVAQRRRANWHALAEKLALLLPTQLSPLLGPLQPGEVPLGFAVRVAGGHRDALRAFLARHKAFCPIHWPLAHLPPEPRFAADRALANCALTLPIDQRMTDAHVQRLADLVEQYFREST